MLRIKQRTSGTYTLTASALDDDGVVQDISAPYTVTIKNGAGTTVATGTPTYHQHVLTYTPAVTLLPDLDTYSVTWTGIVSAAAWSFTDTLELAGGYLFEIADLRAEDRAFENANKYPSETLRKIRTWVEDTIESERAAAVAFVPRSRRITIDGTDSRMLILPDFNVREVLSITVDGTAWTNLDLAEIVIDDNALHLQSGYWIGGDRNVEIHYTHGHDLTPGPITRAALMLAREYLIKSDLPGRATATSIGDQMFRLTIAGRDGVTGLPEVDAAISQFGRKRFGIA